MMTIVRFLRCLSLALAGSVAVYAADAPVATGGNKVSPFMPPASAAQAATTGDPGENLEFAGISSVGNRTDFIIHDKSAKKSFWIGVGETKNGVALVSHDPRRDILTVTTNGLQKQLPLRKASTTAGRGTPAPAPIAFQQPSPSSADISVSNALPPPAQPQPTLPPPPGSMEPKSPSGPNTPEVIVKQETEARMLVSDLLEIGMAQRRAYEEAQRRGQTPGDSPTPDTPKQP